MYAGDRRDDEAPNATLHSAEEVRVRMHVGSGASWDVVCALVILPKTLIEVVESRL